VHELCRAATVKACVSAVETFGRAGRRGCGAQQPSRLAHHPAAPPAR
jgi:hypothetical protein